MVPSSLVESTDTAFSICRVEEFIREDSVASQKHSGLHNLCENLIS